ncbi:hypothetical protein SO802_005771 [Lithocarpus litseifolius]|uniref:Reverse transcriptase zinc-binding domain-containing protein n=1 Tax=Lithocarpus litseifolius TaxID=425828 RepID=A0AAW2DLU9_9ROSI
MGWEVFHKNVQYKVGVGDKVKFWKDRWCGDLPLKLAFVLYKFAANKEAFVKSCFICQGVGDRRIWDVCFNRGPNDWEADVVDEFLSLLASNLPLGTDRDSLKWKLTKNGDFTIRSYYHKLYGSSSVVFPCKGIWKVKASRHVSFFVWTAVWDRILTGDNMRLRGFDFVDRCIMCRGCGETVDHLLLHSGKALRLWCFVFSIFGISWVPSCKVSDFLFS